MKGVSVMQRWIGIAAGAVLAVGIVGLVMFGPSVGGVESLRDTLLSYGPWAVAISAALMITQAIIAPLPANVITITNALVFGPLWGGLLSWGSTLLASSLCFFLSKLLGKPFAMKIVGNSLHGAERFFEQYGLQAVFVVRIMPFMPFDAISYGAGLVGVPFWKFLTATGIGIIPGIIIYSYIGTIVVASYYYILLLLMVSAIATAVVGPRVLRIVKKYRFPTPEVSEAA
jgi:uncharacterized membrane protein YdjX (TVP38/TMEM64 family)